jgi:hypothetical protein
MSLDDLEDRIYALWQRRRLQDQLDALEAEAPIDGLFPPLPERPSPRSMPATPSEPVATDPAGFPTPSWAKPPTARPNDHQRVRVTYTTWTAMVFDAFARCAGISDGMVGLPAVAAELGFGGLTWDDFARHEGMPEALVRAMSDLDRLSLVTFENIDYGNKLTPIGRYAVNDGGLASIWPELAKIHLSARETTLLSKLYEASTLDGPGWADLQIVDADAVAGLVGLDAGDSADLLAHRTFLGDLELRGLVEPGPDPNLYRPTYVAAVLLTESVGQASRTAGPIEVSTSAVTPAVQPGTPRPKGRPRGTGYIADCHAVLDAYRRAKQRPHRNPSKTPSLEIVAGELDVSARTLADYLKTEGIPWPPE